MLGKSPNDRRPRCVIVGAGGHGRVVLDILMRARQYHAVGFLDSNPALHGRRMDGVPVLGDLQALPDLRAQGIRAATVAIGDNGVGRAFVDQIEGLGFDLINAVHPSANLARNVRLGRNIVVAAGALVCAHCQIGDSAILNTGCIVDHESMIGTAVHICPGARLAGRVTVEGLSREGLQGDVAFCDCLEKMGCRVEYGPDSVAVTGRALKGIDVNMNAISDTVQTLGAVALVAEGPTRVTGVGHIRHKETDRIAALSTELRKLGATVEERPDGLEIVPGRLRPAVIDTYDDHRMAMSLALVGLATPGVVIRDPGCTAKTYPDFFKDLDRLAGRHRRLGD